MNKLIIDRFEESFAICEREDKSLVSIPKYKLPLHCKEGDLLLLDSNGMYQKDTDATQDRTRRIRDKMNRLFE